MRGRRVSAAGSDVVEVVNPVSAPATRASRVRRPQWRETGLDRRSQAAAAPPERVSDSLTNEGGVGMPRGHYLAEAAKGAIWVLRAEGVSEAEVGRRLGLPKRTVSKYL